MRPIGSRCRCEALAQAGLPVKRSIGFSLPGLHTRTGCSATVCVDHAEYPLQSVREIGIRSFGHRTCSGRDSVCVRSRQSRAHAQQGRGWLAHHAVHVGPRKVMARDMHAIVSRVEGRVDVLARALRPGAQDGEHPSWLQALTEITNHPKPNTFFFSQLVFYFCESLEPGEMFVRWRGARSSIHENNTATACVLFQCVHKGSCIKARCARSPTRKDASSRTRRVRSSCFAQCREPEGVASLRGKEMLGPACSFPETPAGGKT